MPTIPQMPTVTNVSVDVVNAIRNSASQNYRDYVPVATPDTESIRGIGKVMMDFPAIRNEFLSNLITKFGKTIYTSKSYKNPFRMFKKGIMEFGETIEEIFVNLCKVQHYDDDAGESVFKREIPDVRSAFHVLNYQKQYPTTINNNQLRTAFNSWDSLNSFFSKVIEAMYTASEYDELQVMKYMIARQALDGLLKVQEIPAINKDNMEDIVATMRETSNNMEFLKTDYNLAGVYNNALKEDQYIIVSTAFDAKMSVEVLAMAFNMDKAELIAGKRVLIDGFGNLDNKRLSELFKDDTNYKEITPAEKLVLNSIPAIVIDGDWWQVYDNLIQMDEMYNPKSMYWNYFLQTWKIFSVSPFACNTMFVAGAPSVTSVAISPLAVTSSKGQSVNFTPTVVTENFASKSVEWSIEDNISTNTFITQQGVLHIGSDETALTITVTATSTFDDTKSGSATVTIA